MRNDVLLILFNLFGGVLGLLSLAMMLLIIWFVIALGIPLLRITEIQHCRSPKPRR